MSTLIGSDDTHISIKNGEFKITVGGDLAFQVITDPGQSNPGVEFATKTYVDSLSINDLTS
jgi:hypothetical protein